MAPSIFYRLQYSPILAQMVIIRRCNLSCGYCSEYDKTSKPVLTEALERQLEQLVELGTFGICLTGGEPTLHPDLPRLIRKCRDLGFLQTGMITNGFLLRPEVIDQLNDAGLQKMQISIDGVYANETTQKVLNNLRKRLQWLSERARFSVTVSAVIGSCPPREALEVVNYVHMLGFRPRVLFVHDQHGRLKLGYEELQAYKQIVRRLPKISIESAGYRRQMIQDGSAPFKCRAGSRYLYIDEHGQVGWCSQTRERASRPLLEYTLQDLKDQFYSYKPCHATCTLGCVRSASELDRWRRQEGTTARVTELIAAGPRAVSDW